MYKARLRVNGHLVAIKVQRPQCESIISLDLYVLRFYAGIVTRLLRMLKRDVDLRAIIDDFGELIYREIDYRAEMVNCQRFAELYANIPDVFVPKVISRPDYSCPMLSVGRWIRRRPSRCLRNGSGKMGKP